MTGDTPVRRQDNPCCSCDRVLARQPGNTVDMRTDPAEAGRKPGDGLAEASEQASDQANQQASDQAGGDLRGRWRRWRTWLPFLVKPLRRGIILFALVLIVEYLVVPELVVASKDLYLLGRVDAAWLVAGLVLEGLSVFCYGLL